MTSQKHKKPAQSRNRPTDPFGGPPRNRNTISFGVVLIAFAFFVLLQWTGGDLGGLLNGSVAPPTVAASTETPQPAVDAQETDAENSQATQATIPARTQETPTPVDATQARATATPRATTQPTPTANAPPTARSANRASDLPTIAYRELPPEAHETIALIEQGGPFPFDRDGITFQNRERLLPRHPEGYYREYTVITPGSRNRGARRIVAGDEGEMYYTADHYDSFREIIR